MREPCYAFFVAAALVIGAASAHAQPASAQAEVLFRQGRELMAAGKLAEACSAFEVSQKLEPEVSTLLNLADCREKLGQLATAWGLFLDAARQTRSATDADTQRLHDVAKAHAEKLESRVSKLTISVPQKSQVDGLEITRGTERIAEGLWNRALPIDGGNYTITAHAPGANQWSTQVKIAVETDTKTVEIPDLRTLPRDLEKPAAPSALTAIEAKSEPAPATPTKLAPLIVGGGGLVLLGGALVVELSARSSYDAAKAELMNQQRRNSLYDTANTKRLVAEAMAATGLVAGGVAVWLYVRGRSVSSGTTALIPTPTGLAVAGQF